MAVWGRSNEQCSALLLVRILVVQVVGKHLAIILQKDFEHGRRYRHPFRSRVDFVESCCRNEGQHILNSWAEKFLVQ
jgi:hypothetical protein